MRFQLPEHSLSNYQEMTQLTFHASGWNLLPSRLCGPTAHDKTGSGRNLAMSTCALYITPATC